MANRALCIRCGEFKREFLAVCLGCGFEPKDDVDVAKSRILDFPYAFADGEDGDVVETGRSVAELKLISRLIKSGTPYSFPEDELQGVLRVWRQAGEVSVGQWLSVILRWLAPPAVVAAVVLAYAFWQHAA